MEDPIAGQHTLRLSPGLVVQLRNLPKWTKKTGRISKPAFSASSSANIQPKQFVQIYRI
jgi:hypothetical protein